MLRTEFTPFQLSDFHVSGFATDDGHVQVTLDDGSGVTVEGICYPDFTLYEVALKVKFGGVWDTYLQTGEDIHMPQPADQWHHVFSPVLQLIAEQK